MVEVNHCLDSVYYKCQMGLNWTSIQHDVTLLLYVLLYVSLFQALIKKKIFNGFVLLYKRVCYTCFFQLLDGEIINKDTQEMVKLQQALP